MKFKKTTQQRIQTQFHNLTPAKKSSARKLSWLLSVYSFLCPRDICLPQKLNFVMVLGSVFLISVCSSSYAWSAGTEPDIDIRETSTDSNTPSAPLPKNESQVLETMSKGPVPELKKNSMGLNINPNYFYRYEESLTLRLGLNNDFGDPSDGEDENASGQFGFMYMLESKGHTHVETGFDLFPKREEFLLHAGFKTFYFFTEEFRPYYKVGAALKLDSGDKFNTPLKTENYFIMGAVGFEDILRDPFSIRVDLELFYGKENILFTIYTGLSYGF